jgi:hypothetical protein
VSFPTNRRGPWEHLRTRIYDRVRALSPCSSTRRSYCTWYDYCTTVRTVQYTVKRFPQFHKRSVWYNFDDATQEFERRRCKSSYGDQLLALRPTDGEEVAQPTADDHVLRLLTMASAAAVRLARIATRRLHPTKPSPFLSSSRWLSLYPSHLVVGMPSLSPVSTK